MTKSTGAVEVANRARERRDHLIYHALRNAAIRSRACPSDSELGAVIGGTSNGVHCCLKRLVADGKIVVNKSLGIHARIIEICGTKYKTLRSAPRQRVGPQRDRAKENARRKELEAAKLLMGKKTEMEMHSAQLDGHRFEDVALKPRRVNPKFVPVPFPVHSHGVAGYGR
jgi:hypothetical protein